MTFNFSRFSAPRAGTARIAFSGALGTERDALEVPLRVDVPAVREASATFARVDEATTVAVNVPADRISASLVARLSSTALAGLGFVTRDLLQYPYGCLEQRTSAARAFLAGREVLRSTEATILLNAVTAYVDVVRDQLGIPHIRAGSLHDAFFAQGFVHAQDRLWQMEYDRRRAAGRWAEYLGRGGVEQDTLMRRLGLVASAKLDYSAVNAETRAMLDAYAAGVNAFI